MPSVPSAVPEQGPDRHNQVQTLFSEIAPRYDLLNHVLSLNIDRSWRSKALDRLCWEDTPDGVYLDACSGTFDLALELARRAGFQGRIAASDFARPMLVQAATKIQREAIDAVCGDSL